MKFLLKHWLQAGVSALCVSAMIVPGFTVHATEIDSMEQQSSQLKNELSGINQDLLELGSQIADLEDQIKRPTIRSKLRRLRLTSQRTANSSSLRK